jgi:hypothetical protein
MATQEVEARLARAKAAKEMVERMRACIRSLDKRADEVFRGTQEEKANFLSALDRAEDALQGLWHYLSCNLAVGKDYRKRILICAEDTRCIIRKER